MGPDLTNPASRKQDVDWQVKHLVNPEATSPGSMMPSYSKLPQEDLKALVSYVLSKK